MNEKNIIKRKTHLPLAPEKSQIQMRLLSDDSELYPMRFVIPS